MHAHDFKIAYKGTKGIALQCIHCGQPARLRAKYDRMRRVFNFFLYTPLLYLSIMSKNYWLRFGFLVLDLLLLYIILPFFYAIVLKKVKCQEKIFESCEKDDLDECE